MSILPQLVTWMNCPGNVLGELLLAPLAWLPGWLSATLVSAVTGWLLLFVFKYTSHQRAIKRIRDNIRASLLSVKLFPDSASVALRAQGAMLLGALQLMVLALVPMLVMIIPVCLLLGQLALWYQCRPLHVGEEAVVTLTLNRHLTSSWPEVRLQPTAAAAVVAGPVRILGSREICWNIKAREAGYQQLVFEVGKESIGKSLAIGDHFMRVSMKRPSGRDWLELLLHPAEEPFAAESPVASIEIDYPDRQAWTCGTDWWIAYWFVMSMVAGLCFRPLLGVHI